MNNSPTKEQSDTARLNWYFMNVILETEEEDGMAQCELQAEAEGCGTPDEFRRFIDKQMGIV